MWLDPLHQPHPPPPPNKTKHSPHTHTQVSWDCHLLGRQRTGAAVRTRGGNLPCKSLIHAVTPRYSSKYALAGAYIC